MINWCPEYNEQSCTEKINRNAQFQSITKNDSTEIFLIFRDGFGNIYVSISSIDEELRWADLPSVETECMLIKNLLFAGNES